MLSRLQFFRCSQDPRVSDEKFARSVRDIAINGNYRITFYRKKHSWPNHMLRKPLTDLTIVIVEDHDDTRMSIGSYLDRLGANVIGARTPFEGLELIKNNQR